MQKDQTQEFMLRITNSNRSQLIVVAYEIMEQYAVEALSAHKEKDLKGFKSAIRKIQRGVTDLIEALNFNYGISSELLQLYLYVNRTLARAVIKESAAELEAAQDVLQKLRVAFVEVSKQDHSAPIMQNAQQIYAGLTYGKGCLHETYDHTKEPRGFLV